MSFIQKLEEQWRQGKFVCIGLDSDYSKLPEFLKKRSIEDAIFEFNKAIIDSTNDLVCAYKPNIAFYEAYGLEGLKSLKKTIEYLKKNYPKIPIILDAKRGDIGNTSRNYAKAVFDFWQVDAVTVNPYLGKDALVPFLDHADKGIIVLVKTSNPSSNEFQNQIIKEKDIPLYQVVAQNVAQDWNKNGNCAVVVGATYPEELKKVREIVKDMPILLPGLGNQGGDLKRTVEVGKDSKGEGIIISTSQNIIFASSGKDYPKKAREEVLRLNEEINRYRK